MGDWIKILTYGAFGLMLLLLLFFLISWFALGTILFKPDDYVIGIGQGYSMEPLIKSGDLLVVDTTPENLSYFDIIVYRYEYENKELLVGHRILRETMDGYWCKGDNVSHLDPILVKKDLIVGKVEAVAKDPLTKEIVKFWIEQLSTGRCRYG